MTIYSVSYFDELAYCETVVGYYSTKEKAEQAIADYQAKVETEGYEERKFDIYKHTLDTAIDE